MKNNQIRQFGITEIIFYHLLPGIPIILVIILLSNPKGFGLSIFPAVMSAILFGLIPTQLGILYFSAKKENKKIKDIICFLTPLSLRKSIFSALPCMLTAIFVFGVIAPVERPIWTIFNWIPNWFRLDLFDISEVSKTQLPFLIFSAFILNGILGPFAEEIYFRGFLLPRMEKLGKFAPFVNTILFSLYHMFTPWENFTRILAMMPYIYVVWYKKNIKIGMIVHLTLNIFSTIGLAVTAFSS